MVTWRPVAGADQPPPLAGAEEITALDAGGEGLYLADILLEYRRRRPPPSGEMPIEDTCPTPAARAMADIGTPSGQPSVK